MARYKANEVEWDTVAVLGKECLFSDLRIDRETIPEGYTMYEVRHSDEDWGEPVEIAIGIMVNFYGTLLTKEPFDLEPSTVTNNSYLWIDDADWSYTGKIVKI